MGQPSSIATRVLERMDAFLDETDTAGRMPNYCEVASAPITGKEDGAHFSSAPILRVLSDTRWTIPPVAVRYRVGEAMGSTDFRDLPETPDKFAQTAAICASNTAHPAALPQADRLTGRRSLEWQSPGDSPESATFEWTDSGTTW